MSEAEIIKTLESSLETKCAHCGGTGVIERMYDTSDDLCSECLGAGYIATDFGKRIIQLVRHQSRAARID